MTDGGYFAWGITDTGRRDKDPDDFLREGAAPNFDQFNACWSIQRDGEFVWTRDGFARLQEEMRESAEGDAPEHTSYSLGPRTYKLLPLRLNEAEDMAVPFRSIGEEIPAFSGSVFTTVDVVEEIPAFREYRARLARVIATNEALPEEQRVFEQLLIQIDVHRGADGVEHFGRNMRPVAKFTMDQLTRWIATHAVTPPPAGPEEAETVMVTFGVQNRVDPDTQLIRQFGDFVTLDEQRKMIRFHREWAPAAPQQLRAGTFEAWFNALRDNQLQRDMQRSLDTIGTPNHHAFAIQGAPGNDYRMYPATDPKVDSRWHPYLTELASHN